MTNDHKSDHKSDHRSEEHNSEKKSFTVSDKRRFDAEGNTKSAEPGFTMPENEPAFPAGTPEIDFSSFIVSLATQGMMQLGEMPAPSGVSIPADTAMAKQTIDILVMLREKTKGNLDEFEEQLFDEVLHNIRMIYVKKTAGKS